MTRRAGVNVPLFSCRTSKSWGIGEIGDVEPLARWLAAAGFSDLMVLPLGTMPDGETSPYSASSTLAIDPIYISL
jgi:4-alpha-glucanotransferase